MEKLGLNQIRENFLSFFESKGHLRLKSSPLVPQNDNSLLLINSGMAPLKPYFAGEIEPPALRATSCQKCIRTPDIENVGKDARHGTYFEMLGNFSFGDYFKKDAITWAWEFITQVMKMPVSQLYVSVYLEDDETYDIWTREIGVAKSHMVRMGKKDNFWEIGSGPCGPCSEIYFDRGEKYKCDNPDCAVGCECDRYVEFWNLVFTQFSSDGKGTYTPLQKKNIDTGMGLERLACIMQEVTSLFEVDTMIEITNHVSTLTGIKYGHSDAEDVSLKIITDHIRSTTMMICDGVMPSNEGRGYVLRRLLRRAARHGRLLGLTQPFLHEVCDTVIKSNEKAYPELREKQAYIKKLIKTEEERFGATIESGLVKLDDMISELKSSNQTALSGSDAFKLYDTYGFPIDLTVEILEEQNMTVSRDEFDANMLEQRTRARKARGNTTELGWEGEEVSLADVSRTEFVGYDVVECESKVIAIIRANEFSGVAIKGDKITLFAEKTPFYAESGGQTSDTGFISCSKGSATVLAVRKNADNKYMHICEVISGEFHVDETVKLQVDIARRNAVRRAHSATHLLQKALRSVLGEHVEQAGSLVEPDKLRFDFTHFEAMTASDILSVESMVNDIILEGMDVNVNQMPIADAKKIGAMALFGEKYGDVVRVVKIGDCSVELCGGTHIDNTAKIGAFKIVSESSVAAGVRRIEAFCGKGILSLVYQMDESLNEAASSLKTSPGELVRRVLQMNSEMRELNHQNEELKTKLAKIKAIELLNFARAAGKVNVVAVKVDENSADTLRSMGDSVRDRAPNMVCVLAMVQDGKVSFAVSCGAEAVKKGAHAGNIVKAVAQICGGGGGGRPESAMAGAKNADMLEHALEQVNNIVEAMIK